MLPSKHKEAPHAFCFSLLVGYWELPQFAFHFSYPDMPRTTKCLEMSAALRTFAVFIFTSWLAIHANQNLLHCVFSVMDWHGFLWDMKVIQHP